MKRGWKATQQSGDESIDWGPWLSGDRLLVDPYLVWADLTEFRGLTVNGDAGNPPKALPIAVEVDRDDLPVPRAGFAAPRSLRAGQVWPEFAFLDIPAAYTTQLDGPDDPVAMLVTRYFTASIDRTKIKELLRHAHCIKRIQLGAPRIPAVTPGALSLTSGAGRGRARVVVGVIDDGFAFAHPQFLDPSGRPRTVYLWDQNPRTSIAPFRTLKDFGYGGELHWDDLCAAVNLGDELSAYRCVNYVPRRPTLDEHATSLCDVDGRPAPLGTIATHTHGTSVLDLCAGNTSSVARASSEPYGTLAPPSASDLEAEVAMQPLVLVQLPTRTTADTTGGSLVVHLLDGIRYILRRAESIAPSESAQPTDLDLATAPRPADPNKLGTYYPNNLVVINISYGAQAGGHDGTSILEDAIRALVHTRPERPRTWVVVAAGNAHESRTHARLELKGGGPSKTLTWRIGPDNLLESYLELWIPPRDRDGDPRPTGDGDTFGMLDQVLDALQVRVHPPGGLSSTAVKRGDCIELRTCEAGPVVAAAVFPRRVAQSRQGTMMLLAVTNGHRPADASSTVLQGDWQIELSLDPAGAVQGRTFVFHAWAERNDQLWGNVRPQQAWVFGDDPVPPATEFSVTTLAAVRHGLKAHTDEAPRPFLPDISMSSVGSLAPPPGSPSQMLDDLGGRVLPAGGQRADFSGAFVVGGLRLHDHEVPRYSASGPARGTCADGGRMPGGRPGHAGIALDEKERNGPDISAPSDIGTATRGLPTIGMLSGSQARLSGTSAAAPLVTRYIAARAAEFARQEAGSGTTSPATRPWALSPPADATQAPDAARLARGTPTPTRDDRFRRGRDQLLPRPVPPPKP